ncbi:MAG: HDOD domain-containing protein [Planctomycetes bacterium]|nr:HDOD domain-containing protein [Planctomycetota bacterium]
MGLLGALLERIGWRRERAKAPPRAAPVPTRPAQAAAPAAPASVRQTPVAPLPVAAKPAPAAQSAAAPAAVAAKPAAELTAAELEALKKEQERAALLHSFQATIVDRRFQSLDIDQRFVDEMGASLQRNRDDFALPPAAAFDVMRLLDTSTYPVKKVAAAISCDPSLAGAVLSLANSPLHRGSVVVENVPSAVVRLGQRHLRLLLMDIALHSTRVHGKPFEAFSTLLWKHSLLTAQLAHQIAGVVRVDPEHAYIGGLFHDIGCIAALSAARRMSLRQERKISPQTLLAILSRFGYALNESILARWRLPESVGKAVATRRDLAKAGDHADLAAVIELANELSRPLGAWVEKREVDLPNHPAVVHLQIDLGKLPDANVILELAGKIERVAKIG